MSNEQKYDNAIRYVIIAAGVIVFALTAFFVTSGRTSPIDDWVRLSVYDMRTPAATVFWKAVTHCGDVLSVVAVIGVLLLLPRTRRGYGFPAAATALVSVALYKIAKMLFARPRPDSALWLVAESGYSFPSGHSMSVLVVYGMLIFLIRRSSASRAVKNALTGVIGILIFLIGVSRVYVGVHFATDIVGGWSLGVAVLTAITLIYDIATGDTENKKQKRYDRG